MMCEIRKISRFQKFRYCCCPSIVRENKKIHKTSFFEIQVDITESIYFDVSCGIYGFQIKLYIGNLVSIVRENKQKNP